MRRLILLAIAVGVLALPRGAAARQPALPHPTSEPPTATAAANNGGPSDQPFKTQHMWDARVTIAGAIVLGKSK